MADKEERVADFYQPIEWGWSEQDYEVEKAIKEFVQSVEVPPWEEVKRRGEEKAKKEKDHEEAVDSCIHLYVPSMGE